LISVILDTNVLLSAVMSPRGVPHLIWSAWKEGEFTLITSSIQIEELRRVLNYPKIRKRIPPSKASSILNNICHANVMKSLPDVKAELHDENDIFLLQMALASNANYLVTGDSRAGLLQMERFFETAILTPSDFYDRVLTSE